MAIIVGWTRNVLERGFSLPHVEGGKDDMAADEVPLPSDEEEF